MRTTLAKRLSSISAKCLSIAIVTIMCATTFFVAGASRAPVEYPEGPTMTGSIVVYGGGVVATMEFEPPTDGIWWFSVTDYGLKRVDTKVYDVSSGLLDPLFAETLKFSSSRNMTQNSTLMQVLGGHTYVVNVQGAGKLPNSALLIGWFKSTVNLRPVAIISGPNEALADEPVTFSGNASYDLDGEIVAWSWSFGDGTMASGPVATHTYAVAGPYLVRLIVYDDDGAAANTSMAITVLQPGPVESQWSQPVSIGVPSNQSCFGLSAAMNSKGEAAVAWSSYQTPSWRVWARRYAPESGWQSAELVGDSDYSRQPAVGIDDAGNVTVAWIMDNVLFTRRNVIAYGSWDAPVAVTNGTGLPTTISLAVAPRGQAVLAWLEQVGSHYCIFASVRAVGNSWSAPALIENSADQADSPSASIDHFGMAVVVFSIYVVQPTPQWDVWANTYIPGQGWQGATLVEDLGQFSYLPIVSMDESGTAFATWCYMTNTGYSHADTVYASRYVSGVWQTPVRLDPGTSPSPMYPRVSAWGPANATFIWLAQDDILGRPGEIRASRYMAGVGWTAPTALNTGARIWNPRLAVDESGDAYVGSFQYNSSTSTYDVVAALYSHGGSWSEPETLGSVSDLPKALAVAAGPEGDAIMAWTDYGLGTMWASSHSTKAPPIAEAGPTQYLWGEWTVTFNGTGSYSDIGSYVWTWTAGNGSSKSAAGLVATIPSEWFFSYGNYTVTLTVTNADGRTATDTVAISWGFRIEATMRGAEGIITPAPGYYKLRIENCGMSSFVWTIIDCDRTSPPYEVFNETVTFSSPDELLITDAFWMEGGRWYQSEYVPSGPAGSYMTIYSYFVAA